MSCCYLEHLPVLSLSLSLSLSLCVCGTKYVAYGGSQQFGWFRNIYLKDILAVVVMKYGISDDDYYYYSYYYYWSDGYHTWFALFLRL